MGKCFAGIFGFILLLLLLLLLCFGGVAGPSMAGLSTAILTPAWYVIARCVFFIDMVFYDAIFFDRGFKSIDNNGFSVNVSSTFVADTSNAAELVKLAS